MKNTESNYPTQKISVYKIEKWENGVLVAEYSEESNERFNGWKYANMDKLGDWKGQQMRTYINGEEQFHK